SIKAFGEKVSIHPSVFEELLLKGNVTLQASGDKSIIEIESPISIDAKTPPLFTIISSASIRVNASLNLNGGHLHLKALGKDKTQIVVNEKINVSAENGAGGNIFLEADEIELLEKTKLLATGSYGGGNILVGGDWQGGASAENRVFEDPNKLMQATKVSMHTKAIIDASATDNGNGGTVVLWSDIKNPASVTKAYGTIFAKGGSRSGEGGMIETSGFELLISGIKVKADAPKGLSGSWLLDPYDYVIGSSQATTISNALTGGITVTVSTGNNISSYGSSGSNLDSGSIYVNAAISGIGSGNLSLQAGNFIYFNADVITTGNQSYSGRVFIKKASLSLSTNGGDITFSNDIYGLTGSESLSINAGSGAVVFNGKVGLSGDAISLGSSNQRITSDAHVDTQGVFLYGANAGDSTQTVNDVSFLGFDLDDPKSGMSIIAANQLNVDQWGTTNAPTTNTNLNNVLNSILWTGSANTLPDGTIGNVDVSMTGLVSGGIYKLQLLFGEYSNSSRYYDIDLTNGTTTKIIDDFNQSVNQSRVITHGFEASGESISVKLDGNNGTDQNPILSGFSLEIKPNSLSNLTVTAGTISSSSDISVSNAIQITNSSGESTIGGVIKNATSFVKSGTGTLTLSANNSFTGNTTISSGTLVLENDAPNPTSKTISGTGKIILQPSSDSFSSGFSTSGWTFNSTLSGLTIGKEENTSGLTVIAAISLAGPISLYGGAIAINESLNTTSGEEGDILLKASGDIILKQEKNMTTNGGNLILWSNSDGENENGSILLRDGSFVNTNGGHLWIGGGSGSTTWNGETVGNGFAVSGTTISPSNGGSSTKAGVYLENFEANTSGGDISIFSKTYNTFAFVTHQDVILDSGFGKISLEGIAEIGGNRGGVTGIHDDSAEFKLSSSNSSTSAIEIVFNSELGSGHGASLHGENNFIATNGGISFTSLGDTDSDDYGLRLGYSTSDKGILNFLSSTGTITIDLGANGYKSESNSNSSIHLGAKSGTDITSSSSNVVFKSDRFNIGSNPSTNALNFNTTGEILIAPSSSSFREELELDDQWNLSSYATSLTIGTSSNTSDITISDNISTSGPISIYGGDITLSANISSTLSGADILLKATENITFSSGESVISNGGDVIFWTDSDLDDSGYIEVSGNGHNITTSGGDVYLAGGSGTTTPTGFANGASVAHGFNFTTSSGSPMKINTTKSGGTAGDVMIKGKSTEDYSGVWAQNLQIFSHDLTIEGETPTASKYAVRLGSSAVYNGSNLSLFFDVENDLTITAINRGDSYEGFTLRTGVNPRIEAKGNITFNLSGILDYNSYQSSINISPGKILAINFDGTASFDPTLGDPSIGVSQGSLIIQSYENDSFNSAFNFNSSYWDLSENLESLTLGKISNTSDITVSNNTSISGPISIYGDDITLSNSLTASGTLLLQGSGATTQSAAVSATTLSLQGSGTFTLNDSENHVENMTAGTATQTTGNISFTNKDALTIGEGSKGILSSGTIQIGTLSGNLTISDTISTTNNTSSAIKLYADQGEAADSEGQGNIIISGTPSLTTGSGGRASLYSGKPASSTGLLNLVDALNVRTGVDSTTT
ncbi:autotransporter-associated beta strand repeat-containing protein, partial [Flavobacteriaceae bacterium]|nr:autotransporter-associated beta strand repeat-containing protein [Flavobacteriaceae bacterium]